MSANNERTQDMKNFFNTIQEGHGGRMTVAASSLAYTAYRVGGENGQQVAQNAERFKQMLETDNSSASRYAAQNRYARR